MLKKITKKLRLYKNEIGAVLAVTCLYTFFYIVGIGCPIKYVTGISCIGCGMTRAWFSVLKLNLGQAFCYHPAFLTPLIALVIFTNKKKMSKSIYYTSIWVIVIILLSVYLFRMFDPVDDIVVCDIKNGLIYKCLHAIFNW